MKKPKRMDNFHESIFEINLNYLKQNFDFLKKKIKPKTKIIAVVKAFAYGHGDIKIAQTLEKLNVDALWVADFEEGVILRKNGIGIPIIIANTSPKSIEQILEYKLDVVVYNFRILNELISKDQKINIHLKFNCGMNRFGFSFDEISEIKAKLTNAKNIKISSICSHLSSSRDKDKDEITNLQLKNFKKISSSFSDVQCKHILNTSGVIRFSDHQYSAVRLGIGLFGVHKIKNLKPISSLSTTISQIRTIYKNDIIGYGGRFKANKQMKIGIVPFGYADGLDRKLGNGNGTLYVGGFDCRILGEISMDSCVIDLSKTAAKEGDRVEIFGEHNNIYSICNKIESIPYEFLSKINRRIKRVYIN